MGTGGEDGRGESEREGGMGIRGFVSGKRVKGARGGGEMGREKHGSEEGACSVGPHGCICFGEALGMF